MVKQLGSFLNQLTFFNLYCNKNQFDYKWSMEQIGKYTTDGDSDIDIVINISLELLDEVFFIVQVST